MLSLSRKGLFVRENMVGSKGQLSNERLCYAYFEAT